ncbi:MAG: 16S rRNA (adenine(1518)-N(6)/adenine(1519)-N(6))-dimethyltransferase RsmA [Eubacterium sp.]|nr:16S rRNA (adenine(1518)-N(6)/adenine(1519)-N(6))-dimethyltransferase RsmA [Eubacterium sp.]MEE3398231.1 16S rRNA (adenine(1518)-N(6)/adenine(1519)-N(6))-dimethyltransferase RsmA [Eubacterium sp.]
MDKNKMLSNPQETIKVIQENGFTFHKKYGQNFLIDSHVIDKIISVADLDKNSRVLEIGPGIGTLTQYLAEAAGEVVAVEIDDKLIPILSKTLAEYDNVRVIHGDILKQDTEQIFGGKPFKIVANLPYYITTPIIMSLLESGVPAQSITVMIQKEVAERMQAAPGSKNYGALSLAVQYYAEPYLAANVPPNCFMPRPNVGSAVINLKRLETPPVSVKDPSQMFKLIRGAFNQRRKTLANAVANFDGVAYSREDVEKALEAMGLDTRVRGEALTLEQFAALSDELTS